MPEWLSPVLVLGGVVAGVIGTIIGHRVNQKKNKADLQLSITNQIVAERDRLDTKLKDQATAHSTEMVKLNDRINAFYTDKAASRDYVAQLKDHIWQRQEPPPPAPPPGYIP